MLSREREGRISFQAATSDRVVNDFFSIGRRKRKTSNWIGRLRGVTPTVITCSKRLCSMYIVQMRRVLISLQRNSFLKQRVCDVSIGAHNRRKRDLQGFFSIFRLCYASLSFRRPTPTFRFRPFMAIHFRWKAIFPSKIPGMEKVIFWK